MKKVLGHKVNYTEKKMGEIVYHTDFGSAHFIKINNVSYLLYRLKTKQVRYIINGEEIKPEDIN